MNVGVVVGFIIISLVGALSMASEASASVAGSLLEAALVALLRFLFVLGTFHVAAVALLEVAFLVISYALVVALLLLRILATFRILSGLGEEVERFVLQIQ